MTEQNINRRQFLRVAGLAGATAVVAAGCGPKDAGSSAEAERLPGGGINFTKETDALIIGAGGAGIWAAHELVDAGITPLLVEKAPSWGGDTMLACGAFPVSGTVVQEQQGLASMSAEEIWEAYKDYYADKRVPELTRKVLFNAVECVNIWTERYGVEWTDMTEQEAYTHRILIPEPGMQNDHLIFEPLVEHIEEEGGEFMFKTRAIGLIVDQDNAVVGARVYDEFTETYIDIKAKTTLLSTGDWVSNQEYISKYLPQFARVPVVTSSSMGDGLTMGQSVGAGLTRMEEESNLMASFAPAVVWGLYDAMIHVTPAGERYCDENSIHYGCNSIHEMGYTYWWTIIDQTLLEGQRRQSFENLLNTDNQVFYGDTPEELAEQMLVKPETLKATIDRYNEMCENGEDTDFERDVALKPLNNPPYVAVKNVLVRYKTIGGMMINENTQVVTEDDEVIPNLYGAGACTGETTTNVHDVSAIGMEAGRQMAAAIKA